jgi:hypothetical protein
VVLPPDPNQVQAPVTIDLLEPVPETREIETIALAVGIEVPLVAEMIAPEMIEAVRAEDATNTQETTDVKTSVRPA